MGLPALILAQVLVSLAPTIHNTNTLAPVVDAAAAVETWSRDSEGPAGSAVLVPDTARRKAVSLSDGYYTRLDIHRYVGYAVLPLYLIEYLAGQKELEDGSAAPLWADKVHKPAAYLLAGVYTINTVTGLINLAEANDIQQGKTRRWVHAVLMLASDAALVYGVAKAPTLSQIDARIAAGKRGGWTTHKEFTVASIGLGTVGYLMMFLWKE